jgi:hypothetical protein
MSSKMTFADARIGVQNLLEADDLTAAAVELAQGTDDLDVLKVAQYALLVPIVSTGISGFLGTVLVERPKSRDPHRSLSDQIGDDVAAQTARAYQQTPLPTRQAIELFARKRDGSSASKLSTVPVSVVLNGGAKFSASSMVETADLNAIVIGKARPELQVSGAEYKTVIKDSCHPALARATMHAALNEKVRAAFLNQASAERSHRAHMPNPHVVRYDPKLQRAVLEEPLKRMGEGEKDPPDVRVGCPLSFDPELLKAYYERVVDEVELSRGWKPVA